MTQTGGQMGMFEPTQSKSPFTPVQPDVCKNRHGGNAQSFEANARGRHEGDREKVLKIVTAAGDNGRTLDETAELLGVAPNRISGRFTQLKVAVKIKPAGFTRQTRTGSNAMVYVAVK